VVHLAIAGPAFAVGSASTVSMAAWDLKKQPPCPGGVFISTLYRYPLKEGGGFVIVSVFVLKPE
jgi:hypothetical protein